MATQSLRLPSAPKHFGETRWGLQLVPFLALFLANFVVSQEVARRLGYAPALGAPTWGGWYAPWAWCGWAFRFWTKHPELGSIFQAAIGEVVLGTAVGVFGVRFLVSRSTKESLKGSEDLHGSSRWATSAEITSMGLTGTAGPYVGAFEDQPGHLQYLRYAGDEHVITLWPSGTGKTAAVVIPSLLSITDSSIVALDAKDELHAKTSGYRAEVGPVFRFAPLSITSSHYNLFQEVRFGSLNDVGDAQNIAKMFCHVPGQESKDPHWDDMADQIVTAFILHEGYKNWQQEKTINGVKILNALTSEDLPRRFAEMSCFPHDPRYVMGWLDAEGDRTSTHPVARQTAQMMLNLCQTVASDSEERLELSREGQGYVTNAVKRFDIYKDPKVQRATEHSDFTVEDLVNHEKPITLYLHFPISDQERVKPLARVHFHFWFSRLTETHRFRQANKWKLRFLFEEAASLGYLEVLDQRIADVRSAGLWFLLIYQNVEQVYKHFTRYQSLLSNCGLQLAAAPNDNETAGEISKATGTVTLQQLAASFSGNAQGGSPKSMTTHVNYVKRELLTPDEVRRLQPPVKVGDRVTAPGDLLLFVRGRYPIYGKQMFYFLDPEFLRRSQIPEVQTWPSLLP